MVSDIPGKKKKKKPLISFLVNKLNLITMMNYLSNKLCLVASYDKSTQIYT